jgi:pimeloyl-ACP methyl ester carboxylesterase
VKGGNVKRVVLTLHGVQSRGVWQKDVVPALSRYGMVHYPLDYGNYSPWNILRPSLRESKVEWLNTRVQEIREREKVERLSVIAHSFGTYIVAQAVKKHQHILLDQVVLCGSILDRGFDWTPLLASGQINAVLNEHSRRDGVVRLVQWLSRCHWPVPDTGAAGISGFSKPADRLQNARFDRYRHSDYFQRGHPERSWVHFLNDLWLSDAEREYIVDLLKACRHFCARELRVPPETLRVSVMLPNRATEQLYYPGGLIYPSERFHVNGRGEREIDLRVRFSDRHWGATFRQRKFLATFMKDWQSFAPDSILRRLPADLRWIVSAPIPDSDTELGWGVTGIINVDCVSADNQLDRTEADLVRSEGILWDVARQITEMFEEIARLKG